jgi:predicted RNase H-like HicB family nuclease
MKECNSEDVLAAIATIEEALGNVRISIDVLLTGATDLERPFPESDRGGIRDHQVAHQHRC